MADSSHIDTNIITDGTDNSGATVVSVVYSNAIESSTVDSVITTGGVGPANTLAIGTVTEGEAGATITGTSPNQTLNLSIPKGDKGDASTVSIGTVTTGVAGSSASVTNVGTSADAVFDFTIPQGEDGGVMSINTKTGDVVLNADDIDPTATRLYVPTPTTNSYFLKNVSGVPTWATDNNTTYSEIPSAEITAGTASTARAITGRRAQEILAKTLGYAYPVGAIYQSTVNSLPSTISAIGTWTQITSPESAGASSLHVQSPSGFSVAPTISATPVYKWQRTA